MSWLKDWTALSNVQAVNTIEEESYLTKLLQQVPPPLPPIQVMVTPITAPVRKLSSFWSSGFKTHLETEVEHLEDRIHTWMQQRGEQLDWEKIMDTPEGKEKQKWMEGLTSKWTQMLSQLKVDQDGKILQNIITHRQGIQTPRIAHQLISVQPLSAPSSAIFYMDFLYAPKESVVHQRVENWFQQTPIGFTAGDSLLLASEPFSKQMMDRVIEPLLGRILRWVEKEETMGEQQKGFRMRYSSKLVKPEYYGVVRVRDLVEPEEVISRVSAWLSAEVMNMAGNVGPFSKNIFPILRRAAPSMLPELELQLHRRVEAWLNPKETDESMRKLLSNWSTESVDDLREVHGILEGELRDRITAFFQAHPEEANQLVLAMVAQNSDTNPELLTQCVVQGTWESASLALANPNLPQDTWAKYCFIDPSMALQNPAFPLWMLENPNFLLTLEFGILRFLATSPFLKDAMLTQLIEAPKPPAANTLSDYLNVWMEAPSITEEQKQMILARHNRFDGV